MKMPPYILDIPSTEYHAATKRNEFVSSHRLALFRKCPELYRRYATGEIVDADTPAFELGRATHTFILEGKDKFNEEYIVADGPINPKTGSAYGRMTKAWADWAKEQTGTIISNADFAIIEKMSESVHHQAKAVELLSSGFAEGTVRTNLAGMPVQIRADWLDLDRGIIADLKTCGDVDRFTFDVRDFGYAYQLAFYAEALRVGGYGKLPECWLIAVEKKEPFRTAVYQVTASTIDDCINAADKFGVYEMLRQLAECRASNEWPTRYEGFGIL